MTTVASTEVVAAASSEEAVQAFGNGENIIVLGGGTIVMPEITHGRLHPKRALLLSGAGMAGISEESGRFRIGAMTPVAELESLPEPLASAARHVADIEIRRQATLGGNICAPPGPEAPRGDLQAPLIALGASVRSAGRGGETTQPVEEFLARPDGRLVLDVEFAAPEAGAHASVRRPHAHAYTVLAVSAARTAGETRVAVSGAGPRGVRCAAVERALASGEGVEAAADAVLEDVQPHDDALASAWYRSQTLPVLVRRALSQL